MKKRWACTTFTGIALIWTTVLAGPVVAQQDKDQAGSRTPAEKSAATETREKATVPAQSNRNWVASSAAPAAGPPFGTADLIFGSPAPGPAAAFPQGSSGGNPWSFNFTPYLWFSSFSADHSVLGQPVSVSAGFADIFDELNFGWMNTFEARKGRWGIGTDLMYINLDNLEFPTPPAVFPSVRTSLKQFMLGPQVAFRVAESERGSFDVITGFRYWHANVELETGAGLLPAAHIEKTENFVNPLIGGRFRVNLGRGWYIPVAGDVGGFGAGSDFAWHGFAGVGKDVKRSISLLIGYRAMGLQEKPIEDLTFHGLVIGTTFRWGGSKPAPPANRSPSLSCSALRSSVYVGSGDRVAVSANASDPDGDPLTYSWSASGGSVQGSGADAEWDSAGVAEGTYRVNVRVDDGKGGTADCSTEIQVEPKPNAAPSMTCSAERSSVLAGERVRITARATDPDGDNLNFEWQASGGQIVGSGSSVQLDTTGLAAGQYTVTGRVEDGRGGAADCAAQVAVSEPPPPPQASKVNECLFRAGSARVDNVCKRILDDVALRLQNEPRASVAIVGYADPAEHSASTLNSSRATQVAKYLVGKGIAEGRVASRSAAGQSGAGKQNRRADIVWVPEGASY